MAARQKLSHDQKTREKIRTSQLINRLAKHALEDLELSTSQVKAIEILLRKTLPDLKQLEISGTVATITHEQWLETLNE
jgi:uncharacterized protein YjiS (DUF1127 family)|tara:strand:- start:656 stop:892 length:237 start_codon:yes stop_codon:yes gene_type:complete